MCKGSEKHENAIRGLLLLTWDDRPLTIPKQTWQNAIDDALEACKPKATETQAYWLDYIKTHGARISVVTNRTPSNRKFPESTRFRLIDEGWIAKDGDGYGITTRGEIELFVWRANQ